ncbi:MAG: hypothetical protein OJF51_004835 [Nitrospira sp.]|nr:MAG: hypothetical protein OJF51_004835 [Nitrospira sp.]
MLTYRMDLWILLTVLILVHGSVWAEWVAIDARYQSHPLQTAYIDPDTIRRQGNVVELSALIDWKAMQGGRSPTRFYSTKLTKQFDCAERRVRTLAATDFDGHMGMGEVIGGNGYSSEGHWVAIGPGTINEGFWEAACGKQ